MADSAMKSTASTAGAPANVPAGQSVEFTPEALDVYREILTHYPERRAALMSVLWLAQREFGWLSEDVQAYVAELMELPIAWVEGVATFYTMYYKRPMGRHHVQLCVNVSCALRGGREIMAALSRRLDIKPGETTPDGLFSLDRVECLGSCGTAPVIQLNERFIEGVDLASTMELIDRLERGEEA